MNKDLNYLVVGLGLMGGSVAKALSLKGYKVYGYDTNLSSIELPISHHEMRLPIRGNSS